MPILRKRRIKFRKAEDEEPEEQQAPIQRTTKRDMRHMTAEEVESDIDNNLQHKTKPVDTYPLPEEEQEEVITEDHAIMKLIKSKKDTLDTEKLELKGLQAEVQSKLKSLETKIRTHGDEIQALEYIASGEPTMTIMDIIDIINDFKNDRSYKTSEEVLEAMQKTILKSTIESIRQ